MNNSMNSRKNAARQERLQERLDAGFVSKHFPDVSSIVISMMYNQKGIQKSLLRTVNFAPGSYAVFKVACLSRDCMDGGFDLTQIITAMVRNHRKMTNGKLGCESTGTSTDHSAIVYEIAIQYA